MLHHALQPTQGKWADFLNTKKLYEIAAFANSRKSVNPHYLMTRCFDQTGSIRGSGK